MICKIMITVAIFLCIVGFLINLGAPPIVSSADKLVLTVDFILTIVIARVIIDKSLSMCSMVFKNNMFEYFLWSLGFQLIFLYFCWTPYLSDGGDIYNAFDPKVYYFGIEEMYRTGEAWAAIDYIGTVLTYMVVTICFGFDPLVPLFFNAIMLLIAIVLVAKAYVYHLKEDYNDGSSSIKGLRLLPRLLLIPEVIAFSAMTAKDVLCLELATILFALSVLYFYQRKRTQIILILIVLIWLLLIRSTVALTCIGSLIFTFILSLRIRKTTIIYLLAGFIVAVIVSSRLFGGGNHSKMGVEYMAETMQTTMSGQTGDFQGERDNGLSSRLTPTSTVSYFITSPIRCVTYLIPKANPLDNLNLFTNPTHNYDRLTYMTSIIIMLFIPALFWSIVNFSKLSIIHRTTLIFTVFFLASLGFGITNFIQDRYRLYFDFVYFLLSILTIECMGGWGKYEAYAKKCIVPGFISVISLFIFIFIFF